MPGPSLSMAVFCTASRIISGVSDGLADLSRAAIAAACGAAAEVPRNEMPKPPAPVTDTPSAAVRSGFWRLMPPAARTLPGVNGVPSARKKSLRGPSDENASTWLVALNGFGDGPGGVARVAATLKALRAV